MYISVRILTQCIVLAIHVAIGHNVSIGSSLDQSKSTDDCDVRTYSECHVNSTVSCIWVNNYHSFLL